MKTLILSLSLIGALCAEEWTSLFDGETLAGWTSMDGKPAQEGAWTAEEGVLSLKGKGGNLLSEKEYQNFELRFDWKISKAGNSGVKYRVTRYGKKLTGPEYQILDDERHPDGKKGHDRQSSSLYDLLAADPETKGLNPVGEWNHSLIIANGKKLEHFLNGKKVIEITLGSAEWKKCLDRSKFRRQKGFAQKPKGRILLQDHSDPVSFRKLEIKELP